MTKILISIILYLEVKGRELLNMEINSKMVQKAHRFTKMEIAWYKNMGIDYRTQFGIIMSELMHGHEKEIIAEIVESFSMDSRNWNKYGKSRVYFSQWVGKFQHQYGYWDNNEGKYVTYNRYTKQYNLYDLVA